LPPLPFIPNQVYKRSTIHDQYGGSRQSGISVAANYPYIFIFSLQTGHQHGYKDQWENGDIFSYTGEGQIGDMQFIRGNLALRDHLRLGKRIFLFTEAQRSFVKFETELDLVDFDFYGGKDREGNDRTAIKFFFKRAGKTLEYPVVQTMPAQAAETAINPYLRDIPNETERKGLVTSRVGQGAYRKSILFRWNFKCAVTNYAKPDILIASHIVPWKGASNEERLDVANGILLSPTYDALFDRAFISFENNGKIILSDAFARTAYEQLGVTGKERIQQFSRDNYAYLERHREMLQKIFT
jgi:5-methylcytosine-specific restriction enzyme A